MARVFFSDMGTNACVSGSLRSSTFSDCVAEVNRKYALSDASCEYVQNVASHCQAIYSLKNVSHMATCLKSYKPKLHFCIVAFLYCLLLGLSTHAKHVCRRRWMGVTIATSTPLWRHLPPS